MKKFNFKFNKVSSIFFIMLIVLFLFTLVYNIWGLVNTKITQTVPTKIVFVCISAILLLFVLSVFFKANYYLDDAKIILKFGFFKMLTIKFEDIRQIKHYPQYDELFILYKNKSTLSTHMVCIDKKYFDEFKEFVKI